MPNVLIVNYSDGEGGADRAAYRLHRGLTGLGITSRLLVQKKLNDDPFVIGPEGKIAKACALLRPFLDAVPLSLYRHRNRQSLFSLGWLPGRVASQVARWQPEVVHLHWICNGFVPIGALSQMHRSLVWTLHDCWAFTGGCHYPLDCTRYHQNCGCCPQLNSSSENDLSRWEWQRKSAHWQSLELTVVTPSRWMADCAKASSLFQRAHIEVIPNGLDLTRYKPIDRQLGRSLLGLPEHQKLILVGALQIMSDVRKGFIHLQNALQALASQGWRENVRLVVFGASEPASPPPMGLEVQYLGTLHDDISLALVYGAADVFVAPSIQDNLPNTVMESMACGTPTVAFNIGGMSDLIDHLQDGYLARPLDTADLAQGIDWVLSDNERHARIAAAARSKMERQFEISLVARRHLDLYQQLISGNARLANTTQIS